MKNTLIISGHPNIRQSSANRLILEDMISMPDVTVNDIMTNYPDGTINISEEQKKLRNADIVILQFPFHWYGTPSHMRAWIEQVFSYGFAYGEGGHFLANKKLLLSVTLGGDQHAYSTAGKHQHPVETFLLPLELFAKYCGMDYLEPVYSYEMTGRQKNDEALAQKAKHHAGRLKKIITSTGSFYSADNHQLHAMEKD